MAQNTRDNESGPTDGDDLIGCTAIDPTGSKIGKIADVVRDPESGRARWAVIDLGLLKAAHYAPLGEAYRSATDELVLDLDRRIIASAPKAGSNHELTPQLAAELDRYYDHA